MPPTTGFWSYVHADDQAENGRIRQLVDDLSDQYAVISGEPIEIFVDRNDLVWGDNWREKLDISLTSGLFFIPIITPRFFQSTKCRRELQAFARSATNLGVRELILPLVYVNVPTLNEESPSDEAVALVKTFQWVDWRELRFENRTSGAYRRGVVKLAQRLVEANEQISIEESTPAATPAPSDTFTDDGDDEAPGTLDLLVLGEAAMPKLAATIIEISPEMVKIGDLAQTAANDMKLSDQQGKGFTGRAAISSKLALDLTAPADRILELANIYTASLYDADRSITALTQQAPEEVKSNPSTKQDWMTFAQGIAQLSDATNESMAGVKALAESLGKPNLYRETFVHQCGRFGRD